MPVKRELEVRARCSARSTTAFAFGENCLSLVSFAIALKEAAILVLHVELEERLTFTQWCNSGHDVMQSYLPTEPD